MAGVPPPRHRLRPCPSRPEQLQPGGAADLLPRPAGALRGRADPYLPPSRHRAAGLPGARRRAAPPHLHPRAPADTEEPRHCRGSAGCSSRCPAGKPGRSGNGAGGAGARGEASPGQDRPGTRLPPRKTVLAGIGARARTRPAGHGATLHPGRGAAPCPAAGRRAGVSGRPGGGAGCGGPHRRAGIETGRRTTRPARYPHPFRRPGTARRCTSDRKDADPCRPNPL